MPVYDVTFWPGKVVRVEADDEYDAVFQALRGREYPGSLEGTADGERGKFWVKEVEVRLTDMHTENCCIIHGCAYDPSSAHCTVRPSGEAEQSKPCLKCYAARKEERRLRGALVTVKALWDLFSEDFDTTAHWEIEMEVRAALQALGRIERDWEKVTRHLEVLDG